MRNKPDAMTILEHLEDLRRAIVVSLLAVAATSGLAYGFFRQELLQFLVQPLEEYQVPLVYLGLSEAFFTQVKLSILAGLLLALPVVIWQLVGFVMPALHPQERRLVQAAIPLGVVLFLGGASFAYLVVFRLAARFLLTVGGPGLQPMLAVGQYVSFLVAFMLPFGLAFELPLAVYFLARWQFVTGGGLARNRKYALLAIFVLAAAVTPGPDAVSQFLLAGPLLALYEISIWVARLTAAGAAKREAGDRLRVT